MKKFLCKLDDLAGIKTEAKIALWLERFAFIFLVLTVFASPHSNSLVNIFFSFGAICWIARHFINPRPKFVKTSLFLPLLAFTVWSGITSISSYAPDISFDAFQSFTRMILIFFFAINNLRTKRAARFLALVMIFSCMINVLIAPIERLVGRGVEIQNVKADSPLIKAALQEGDTLLEADSKKIKTPKDLIDSFKDKEVVNVRIYRPDFYATVKVKKGDLLEGENALEKLGVGSWKRSRNWRSSGFYRHYITYAEVLQLIGSLVFGLLVASFIRDRWLKEKSRGSETNKLVSRQSFLFLFCTILIGIALLLTVSRSPQAAFMVSISVITLLGASRKMFLVLLMIAIPVAIGGLIFLQQSRNVKLFDSNDNSTTWRQTVYKEGFLLWTKDLRNFTVGVGMDSIKRFRGDWGLFDNGRLPLSNHLHSTPLQLVFERGFPALFLWLWILAVYIKLLWRGFQKIEIANWIDRGVILGCLGGLVGFLLSGLVHYNFGVKKIFIVFILIMAIGVKISDFSLDKSLQE